MSYLTDDPLSFDEELALRRSEHAYRKDQLRQVPSSIRPAFNSGYVNYIGNHFLPTLQNDYFKIDIRRNSTHTFVINSQTNEHLQNLIKSRYGKRPLNKYLISNSITIVPCPGQICSLYYHPGKYKSGEHPKFHLISSFVAPPYPVKYSISAPFSDSKYPGKTCLFNWFQNNAIGDVISTVVQSKYTLPENNQTLAWIQPDPLGAFMITGITDAIGFHCSFILNDNYTYRQQPRYTRHYVPRQLIGGNRPGEIGYEIPSQEFYEDNAQEDPLLHALRQ